MLKLFIYVREGSFKGSYGIVECYEGRNVTFLELFVSDRCDYCSIMGWGQVHMSQCNVLGFFPVDDDYKKFLEDINSRPCCAG